LKNANEDLRIELNGTIRQREHEEESLSQGQVRELAPTEENSKLKLENSELKRDNKELRSNLQEGEEHLRSERFNFQQEHQPSGSEREEHLRNERDGLQEDLRQALDQVRQMTEKNKHWESELTNYRMFFDRDRQNRSGPFPHGPSPIRSVFQDSPAHQRTGPADVV
jgi:hypothetical protein